MPIEEGGRFSPTQNIVSPGVFTRENDLSGLAQGVANIGGAIVAPFADGPAFYPNIITDVATLEQRFGLADGIYYGPYTAKEYLLQQGIVTVVRVGGLTGYWQKNPLIIYAQPGEWDRSTDTGALTTASFMYLNSDDYTTNIQYVHTSSGYKVPVLDASAAHTASGAGMGCTGQLTSLAEITSFLGSNSRLANISNLSASLAQAYSDRKLLSITSLQAFTAFSASIVSDGFKVTPKGGATDFTLAWWDVQKSIPSGSLFLSGAIGSAPTIALNDALNGSWDGTTKTFNVGTGSYLTGSIYQTSTGQIKWPFVFSSVAVPSGVPVSSYVQNAFASTTGSKFDVISSYDKSSLRFSGSINGKFGPKAATSKMPSNYDGIGGALSGSKLYYNRQVSLGSVKSGWLARSFTGVSTPTWASGYFYLSSSAQGEDVNEETQVATAIAESTETNFLLTSSILNRGSTTTQLTLAYDEDTFDATSVLTVSSASFAAVRSEATCGAGLRFLGVVKGEYGPFDGGFTANDVGLGDPCNPISDVRKPMVLSVLANTQNASTQFGTDYTVNGFTTSQINQATSSVFPYKGGINPTENDYQLVLNYSYTDAEDNSFAGTYGYYNFSLNESDNNYIKDVFGMDATVGNPAKQIAGQKVEAAYNYVLFEDSIKRFIDEKTRPAAEGGGWQLRVAAVPSQSFATGESMKFVDQYSYDPNSGDSQFAITNAMTPWIYSQKISPFKGSANEAAKPTKFKLFKAHTLSDGTLSNKKYKIEISNVKLAGTVPGSDFGSFTLSVRAYSDTDKRPKYLEIFQNLNLNPDSANFIARRIGDRYSYITFAGKIIEFGTYANLSKYIRIEMTDVAYPEHVVPYGFESYYAPVDSTMSTMLPPVRYSKASIFGLSPGKYASGTVFGQVPEASDELAALYQTASFGSGLK